MNKFTNQKGVALVLTLLVITLSLLFIVTLLFQITNTTKQVATSEENMDARRIANMGIKYGQQWMKQEQDAIQEILNELDESDWAHQVESIVSSMDTVVTIDENRAFHLTYHPETLVVQSENIEFTFTSLGVSADKEVELEGKITISINRESEE